MHGNIGACGDGWVGIDSIRPSGSKCSAQLGVSAMAPIFDSNAELNAPLLWALDAFACNVFRKGLCWRGRFFANS
jgi:hypothetical protein